MHDFQRLDVYQDALVLTQRVFELTDRFPASQRYGLSAQLQRSAISVPSNIAEGAGRGHPRDFARFLRIAIGSVCEVDCQLQIAIDASFGDREEAARLRADADSIRRRLHRLACTLTGDP